MQCFVCKSVALTGALVALACGSSGSNGDKGAAGASTAGSSALNGGSAGTSTGSAGMSAARGGDGGSAAGSSTVGGAGGATGNGGSSGAVGSAGDGSGGSAGSGTAAGGSAGTSSGGVSGQSAGGSAGMGAAAGSTASGGLTNPVPSMGCGTTPTAAPASGPGTIDVGGTSRDYIIRIPDGYDGTSPMRIIFAFHGAQGSAVQVDNGDPPNSGLGPTGPYYGIKEHADDHTIFVAGQANGTWADSDIDYVKALVAKFEGELCLDQSRILATGFSMGGIMTLRVACNLSDVFRAVAPMSCSLAASNCPAGGGPIAYWSSHGEQDTTIDISNGEAARDEFAKRNGCSMDTPMPIGSDGCVAYQDCKAGYPVNWCQFMGIHQPPPFSGPEIWAFLSQF